MKNIALTMRIEYNTSYNEKRDCIDSNWYTLFRLCNFNLVLIPNDLFCFNSIIQSMDIDGFILSGGNNINDEKTIDRDIIEKLILDYSIKNNISVLGICRGMQAIGNYFNLSLSKVNNHIGNHEIILNNNTVIKNSYHNYGFLKTDVLEDLFDIFAYSIDDNIIEGYKHKNYNFYGIMWHPEREIMDDDIDFIKNIFK